MLEFIFIPQEVRIEAPGKRLYSTVEEEPRDGYDWDGDEEQQKKEEWEERMRDDNRNRKRRKFERVAEIGLEEAIKQGNKNRIDETASKVSKDELCEVLLSIMNQRDAVADLGSWVIYANCVNLGIEPREEIVFNNSVLERMLTKSIVDVSVPSRRVTWLAWFIICVLAKKNNTRRRGYERFLSYVVNNAPGITASDVRNILKLMNQHCKPGQFVLTLEMMFEFIQRSVTLFTSQSVTKTWESQMNTWAELVTENKENVAIWPSSSATDKEFVIGKRMWDQTVLNIAYYAVFVPRIVFLLRPFMIRANVIMGTKHYSGGFGSIFMYFVVVLLKNTASMHTATATDLAKHLSDHLDKLVPMLYVLEMYSARAELNTWGTQQPYRGILDRERIEECYASTYNCIFPDTHSIFFSKAHHAKCVSGAIQWFVLSLKANRSNPFWKLFDFAAGVMTSSVPQDAYLTLKPFFESEINSGTSRQLSGLVLGPVSFSALSHNSPLLRGILQNNPVVVLNNNGAPSDESAEQYLDHYVSAFGARLSESSLHSPDTEMIKSNTRPRSTHIECAIVCDRMIRGKMKTLFRTC